MRKFDGHLHTFRFKVPVRESIRLFQRQFDRFGVEKATFLALPCDTIPGKIEFDQTDLIDNLRAMYFKAVFSPNGYAYAGLEYLGLDLTDVQAVSASILEQVKLYKRVGYDGMKMYEGHPNHRKCLGYPLDHEVFDAFFDFCEKENFPILMHLANPPHFWDETQVSEYWKARGCYFDETYSSFDGLQQEVLRRLDKNPHLNFSLAHWGFLIWNKANAEKFMSYPNTKLDVCPGGENFFKILEEPAYWVPFIEKYSDRIIYGTDSYNFSYDNEETWSMATGNRPSLVERFFTTTGTYEYTKKTFTGIGLREDLCNKIFYDNLDAMMGQPSPIDFDYFIEKSDQLLQNEAPDTLEHYNLWCMVNDFRSMKNGNYSFK